MSVLKWENPPARGQVAVVETFDWLQLGEDLAAERGEWAQFIVKPDSVKANNAAAYLKGRGTGSPFRPGDFEATTRQTGRGTETAVYGRFVGRKR